MHFAEFNFTKSDDYEVKSLVKGEERYIRFFHI